LLLFVAATTLSMPSGQSGAQNLEREGKEVVESSCVACHGSGANGAPRIGDRTAWAKRASQGLTSLTQHALEGIRKMPSHGGNPALTDREIQRAVTYMVNQSGGRWTEPIDRARLPAERSGAEIVRAQCLKCHESGAGGAPLVGDRAAWIPRVRLGLDSLVRSAINGHGGMPPRGGMANLTDAEIRNAIVHMFNAGTASQRPSGAARAVARDEYTIASGTTIHLGVVPSRVIRDHPKDFPAKVAAAVPPVPDQYFVTVALFDANSGQRISDALVRARVTAGDRSGPEKTLEATTIGDSATFGNYFAMAGAARYTIDVRVQRPGVPDAIRAKFNYTHE
jgi:cytochrome c5